MNWLTKQETMVVGIIAALLLTGLFVKHYRAAHPASPESSGAIRN
jgi:hypothetical protein